MKFAFGLVGLLLVVGIIAWYWGNVQHPADTVREGERIKSAARQLAGQDETGMRTSESITLEEQTRNGKLEGVVVQDIIADGPMEKHFGLQLDDVIVAVGDMSFRDLTTDAEMAKAMVLEAYQRGQTLTVLRNGRQIILPLPGQGRAAGSNANGNAANDDATDTRTPLQRQLDAIQGPR